MREKRYYNYDTHDVIRQPAKNTNGKSAWFHHFKYSLSDSFSIYACVIGFIPLSKYVPGPILAEPESSGAAPVISHEEYDSHSQP